MILDKLPPVLVVEDSDDDFDTIGIAAKKVKLAFPIVRAMSGGDCLTYLRERATRPAVILMDLNTPGTDGRQVLAEIKSDPRLRDLPIVVLTTSSSPKDLSFCYQTGANAYHVKPIDYPEHLTMVMDVFNYWLGRVERLHEGAPS